MKELVKRVLKSNALGRVIYEPVHKLYRLYSVPHRRRLLHRNGREVLLRLTEVFKKHKIPAYAAYGTLLGFVRDKGFIPHDDDIDIGVMAGDWTPKKVLRLLVEEEGFKYLFGFAYQGILTEFKVSCQDIPIDFFFYEDDGEHYLAHLYYFLPSVDYPDKRANTAKMVVEPRVRSRTATEVFGMQFPIPEDSEMLLEKLYGKSWRIPDANWDDSMHPTITTLPGFGYSVSYEEALQSKDLA